MQNIPLYSLLDSLSRDANAPNIVLNVTLADLRQLMVDTIDAMRERLLPIFMKAEEDKLLTPKEVADRLGICCTSVHNLKVKGSLTPVKVGRSTRYRLSEVNELLNTKNECL